MNLFTRIKQLIYVNDPLKHLLRTPNHRQSSELTERQLIQLESQVSQTIFGPLPNGVLKREFFNLDRKTWIWHEERDIGDGQIKEMTTRYEILPSGVLKVVPGPKYRFIDGVELQNFISAVQSYYVQVVQNLYQRDDLTDSKP